MKIRKKKGLHKSILMKLNNIHNNKRNELWFMKTTKYLSNTTCTCHGAPVAACSSVSLSHHTAVQDLQGSLIYNNASNIIQAKYLKIATFIIYKYHV